MAKPQGSPYIYRPCGCGTWPGAYPGHWFCILFKRQVNLSLRLLLLTFIYSNSEIRVWTFGGDTVYTLSGHTSFVYSLSVLPNGDLVSAGEDRTVRVWQGASTIPFLSI